LLDIKSFKLIFREILHPPIFFLLSLQYVFNEIAFSACKLRELLYIGASTQVSIVKNDYLIVTGKQDIELDEVALDESSFYAFKCILGENTAVTSMGDDVRIVVAP
jgi:hypothetical protein